MTVSSRNQQPAVFVPNPCRYGLKINSLFNRIANEIVTQAVMIKVW